MLTLPVQMSRAIVDNSLIFLGLQHCRQPHNSLKTRHIRASPRPLPKWDLALVTRSAGLAVLVSSGDAGYGFVPRAQNSMNSKRLCCLLIIVGVALILSVLAV